MVHRILVAIDRSKLSQSVFEDALALAKSLSASLVLVNVLSPNHESSPRNPILIGTELHPTSFNGTIATIYQDLWRHHSERELEMLRSLTDLALTAGTEVAFHQSMGSPSQLICKFAQELDVDLIILGRNNRSGLDELILGSTRNYVMYHAPCSVLTIQPQPQKKVETFQSTQVVAA
jgi:nucleotide-binding universal stress UspA family protein